MTGQCDNKSASTKRKGKETSSSADKKKIASAKGKQQQSSRKTKKVEIKIDNDQNIKNTPVTNQGKKPDV